MHFLTRDILANHLLEYLDFKTLMGCRIVCKMFKEVIDKYPRLIFQNEQFPEIPQDIRGRDAFGATGTTEISHRRVINHRGKVRFRIPRKETKEKNSSIFSKIFGGC
jgi:hypothetical protein